MREGSEFLTRLHSDPFSSALTTTISLQVPLPSSFMCVRSSFLAVTLCAMRTSSQQLSLFLPCAFSSHELFSGRMDARDVDSVLPDCSSLFVSSELHSSLASSSCPHFATLANVRAHFRFFSLVPSSSVALSLSFLRVFSHLSLSYSLISSSFSAFRHFSLSLSFSSFVTLPVYSFLPSFLPLLRSFLLPGEHSPVDTSIYFLGAARVFRFSVLSSCIRADEHRPFITWKDPAYATPR